MGIFPQFSFRAENVTIKMPNYIQKLSNTAQIIPSLQGLIDYQLSVVLLLGVLVGILGITKLTNWHLETICWWAKVVNSFIE